MRIRPERLAAYSAFAALALGAVGMLFERADPSVLSAGPAEFASWARAHNDALLAQSVFFSLSAAPLLMFFAGLRAVLRQPGRQRGANRVDLSLVVLGAGALWVTLQLVAQAVQVAMASAAGHGAADEFVASLGDLMHVPLTWANLALGTALGCTAVVALRDRALPRWLGWLSAATAGVQLVSVAGARVQKGPLSDRGALAYLPYPVFVAWLVSAAVSLLRRAPGTA
jgi:hypothetical protein